jgi:hypothetical protein
MARLTLRVPEHLKPHIDDAATREGLSVNAWLVRAISAAVQGGDRESRAGRRAVPQRRYTGWVC